MTFLKAVRCVGGFRLWGVRSVKYQIHSSVFVGLKCSQRSHIHPHRLIYSIYKPSSYTICPRDPYPLVQIYKFRRGRNPSDLCSGGPYKLSPGQPWGPLPPGHPQGPFSLGVLKRALYVPAERVYWLKIQICNNRSTPPP